MFLLVTIVLYRVGKWLCGEKVFWRHWKLQTVLINNLQKSLAMFTDYAENM